MPTRSTDLLERLATPDELLAWSDRCHLAGQTVGMVPTMGALHAGHRALIDRAVAENDRVVVTIFVNPAQFGPSEDFSRYPRTLDADLATVAAAGAHAAFVPSVETMYPAGLTTRIHVDGHLGDRLEGASRPGHLDGVALVVTKLLVAGRPDRAYFGQKDAQQCAVVRHLARDLDTGSEIVVCPTVRDTDGLAISSRNVYLSPEDRVAARSIPAKSRCCNGRIRCRGTGCQRADLPHTVDTRGRGTVGRLCGGGRGRWLCRGRNRSPHKPNRRGC